MASCYPGGIAERLLRGCQRTFGLFHIQVGNRADPITLAGQFIGTFARSIGRFCNLQRVFVLQVREIGGGYFGDQGEFDPAGGFRRGQKLVAVGFGHPADFAE